MKKRILAALLASAAVLSFAGCSSNTTSSSTPADSSSAADSSAADSSTPADESSSVAEESSAPAAEADDSAKTAGTGITVSESEGKVFNIYAWNEEFKGFFEKYYTVPEGITVNWVINPSDDGVYQDKLDAALQAQASAAADDKVDMFLAEADYIIKYVNSDYTMDVSKIGVSALDTEYKYTVDAATDTRNGQLKGVSFQCCPAALIYRRSIAEAVLGTSEPAEVQAKLSDWTKFNEVAKQAKDLGYYMTASYAETFRTFSNNATSPWVDADNNLVIDDVFNQWIDQAYDFVQNEYTLTSDIWMRRMLRCSRMARQCASSARLGTTTSPWATHRIPIRAALATGLLSRVRRLTSGAAHGCSQQRALITPRCSQTYSTHSPLTRTSAPSSLRTRASSPTTPT